MGQALERRLMVDGRFNRRRDRSDKQGSEGVGAVGRMRVDEEHVRRVGGSGATSYWGV